MKQVNKLKQLQELSYFDLETLSQIIELQKESLYKTTTRWIKQKKLIQLRKGLYTTQLYLQQVRDKTAYLEVIANKLRYPSYLSLEYVLSKNQILTESVFAYTSITTKTTRTYQNDLGKFIYQTISPTLFTGYNLVQRNGFTIAEATKTKALCDYLYLKLYRQPVINKEMLNDLRLNLDEFKLDEIQEFAKFCQLTKIEKFIILPKLLFNEKG